MGILAWHSCTWWDWASETTTCKLPVVTGVCLQFPIPDQGKGVLTPTSSPKEYVPDKLYAVSAAP